ncbi:MAG: flagellar biosynthetic protein FliO [Tissierellales bacterium]
MIVEALKVIAYIGFFIIVTILAFFFTKYMAKKSSSLNRGKNMKVIEALFLGNNTKVFIIEILGFIYVVYDNNSHLLLLDKYAKEDVNIENSHFGNDSKEVNNIIRKILKQKKNIVEKAHIKND